MMSREDSQFHGRRGKIGDWVIGNSGEHIGEPSLRINIIELGSLDHGPCEPSLRSLRTGLRRGGAKIPEIRKRDWAPKPA
jgi:hypothetical protein